MNARVFRALDAAVTALLPAAAGLAAGVAASFVLAAAPPSASAFAVRHRGAAALPYPAPETIGTENTTDMNPETIDRAFLDALAAVESNGDDAAVNRREDAHGRYQIRAAYLADANAALGTRYTLAEMHDPAKAERVVRSYLARYGAAWERRTGRAARA